MCGTSLSRPWLGCLPPSFQASPTPAPLRGRGSSLQLRVLEVRRSPHSESLEGKEVCFVLVKSPHPLTLQPPVPLQNVDQTHQRESSSYGSLFHVLLDSIFNSQQRTQVALSLPPLALLAVPGKEGIPKESSDSTNRKQLIQDESSGLSILSVTFIITSLSLYCCPFHAYLSVLSLTFL